MKKIVFPFIATALLTTGVQGQTTEKKPLTEERKETKAVEKKWYEQISLRGYIQVRYNRLLETNSNLKADQNDKSIGDKQGFFVRRGRLVFSGQISKNISFYIQPDFAASVDDSKQHFMQLRDAYFDIGLDSKNEFRIRVGQSKVPYGFENMQSSQNRLSLDRNEALNSAVAGERDLGIFGYWIPQNKKKLIADLAKHGLKSSGDYGILAFGAYNGQTINMKEMNNNLHMVARVTYPFEIGSQVIEGSLQAYKGKFVLPSTDSGIITLKDKEYKDERAAASFILYPKPFGLQAEYNIGTGPKFDINTNTIRESKLEGGYVLTSYLTKINDHQLIPFAKYQYFKGGYKNLKNASSQDIKECEFGLEWQPSKYLELTATYTMSNRKTGTTNLKLDEQKGNFLRLQAQVNF